VHEFPRIKRLPPYVFNITGELKAAARRRGEDIIDVSMGNPDQPTPKHILDKLVETAQRGDTHGYSVSKGIPRLRRAITNWYHDRYGVELDPDTEAIATIGSKEGIAHLMHSLRSTGATSCSCRTRATRSTSTARDRRRGHPSRRDGAGPRLLRGTREGHQGFVPEAQDADPRASRRTRRRSASSCRSSSVS
jgi:hypothetical protein